MVVVSSRCEIDVEKYHTFAYDTAKYFILKYPWYIYIYIYAVNIAHIPYSWRGNNIVYAYANWTVDGRSPRSS